MRARAAILEVKEHSEKETQAWILEFQTNLAQFEKDLKAQIEAGRAGGIDVDAADGNKADSTVEPLLMGCWLIVSMETPGASGSWRPVFTACRRGHGKATAIMRLRPW